MKDRVDMKTIVDLAGVEGPCISLHLPASPTGRGRLEGRIKLKNQLVEAENVLIAMGMRATLARDLLAPATELLSDEHFWEQPMSGLAIYVAPGFFQKFYLPHPPVPHTEVGDRFLVRPLLSILHKPDYFVLALDQQRTRLLRFSGEGVNEVHVPDMPENITEIVGSDYSEKQRQMHASGRHGSATSVVSHGAGDRAADMKDRLHRYALAIDRAVTKHLTGTGSTLVLAADEPFLDTYRHANRYPGLVGEAIVGNPKLLSADQVTRHVEAICERAHEQQVSKAIELFSEFEPKFLATDSIEVIAKSISEGKVGILLARKPNGTMGKDVHTDSEINALIVDALRHGGLVYEVEPAKMPTVNPLAAIYRY